MNIAGHPYKVLSDAQIELIHRSAIRILEEMGMVVQNERLLQILRAYGLQVDFQSERVRFPRSVVERFLAESDKYDWENLRPEVTSTAGVYHSQFHHPETGELVPWDEGRMVYYFALARRLPHIGQACMLGCRLPVPPLLEPLYERYYCWKYGATEGSSIYHEEICPYLEELYQLWADEKGQPLKEVFNATVYLQPPLKLGHHEAAQLVYFLDRGLRVGIGDMYAMGASAPVTMAGAITLNLAERMALGILQRAFFGSQHFHLGSSIMPMDMRTMVHAFGRPEMAVANVMTAQLARFYGASFSGHAGLTDAKLPSPESGAQKALTGTATLLVGGSLWVDAGLLSTDEVCSPVQMILDNELIAALKHLAHEFEISQETIGLEAIFETGPGNQFMDKTHTARHFRQEQWQPSIWTRTMLAPWLEQGARLDIDRAREFALEVQHQDQEPPAISDRLERDILQLIEKAKTALEA